MVSMRPGEAGDAARDAVRDAENSDAAHTGVLVIGAGPAGAAAAVFLARHGLDVTVISRANWVADSPRAHITNQRTMEVMRAVGLEKKCRDAANPAELMANQVLCTSLAGEELARVWSWGGNPALASDYLTASPGKGCDLGQDKFEPILLSEAAKRGARIRWQTKFDSLEQDATGVTVRVTDLLTGRPETIRAAYVVGADGGQSRVTEAIGLPFTGKAGMGNAINVRFTADLSKYVAHRPGSLFAVIQPERDEALGNAMLRMVQPWNDWMVSFVHMGQGDAKLSTDQAEAEVRKLIGDDAIDVEITGQFPWRVNHVVAKQYAAGRVFCMGDAVHRHPPMNGLGANTCIQDAFNLAWKLAFTLKGLAGPGLLASYSVERQPIGAQVVDRAIRSWHDSRELMAALGFDPAATVETRRAQFALLKSATPEGEQRREAMRKANANKAYVYHAHGVEMNQIYTETLSAVVADGAAPHEYARDPQLIVQQTSHPGARLPHCWLSRPGETISTLDLASPESFTLLTRECGGAWGEAAAAVAREYGIEIRSYMIGLGGDVHDAYGDFSRLSEITESGCLLVRPDQHIAWRQSELAKDPAAELRRVLRAVLDR